MEISTFLETNEENYYNNYENQYANLSERLNKNLDFNDPFTSIKEKLESEAQAEKNKFEGIIDRIKILTEELNSLHCTIFKFLDDKNHYTQNDYYDLDDELTQSKKLKFFLIFFNF